jgi:aspartate racemase
MPLSTLFKAPTISHVASFLRKEAEIDLWPSLVAIKPDGTKPPLYCVHGLGGNLLTYHILTKFLEPDRPLYGLQARGLDGRHQPSESLEEIADRYLHDIRAFQPEGPYFIGGYSFGGWVAFEMARQLDRIGQRVAVLALFDPRVTFESRSALSGQRMWAVWGRRLTFHARKLVRAESKLDYVQRRITTIRRRYDSRRWRAGAEIQPSIPLAQRNVTEACWTALRNYTPSPYQGKATLFRTNTESSIFRDPIEEWGGLCAGGLEICHVPGTHLDMFQEPFVRTLADELNVRLQRADIESIF